jgi:hypothetical protein
MTEEPVAWRGATDEAVTRIRIDCGGQSTVFEIRDAQ